MNNTRNGKIARLPKTLRARLNRRLEDGESAEPLLAWLNGLPKVQSLLAAEFGGRPITEQNLSEWRKGSYRDWLMHQEALELAKRLAEDAVELQPEGRPPLTDTLALWLATRYAVAAQALAAQDGPESWRQLRKLCADLVELRRSDHRAERLRLERMRLELARGDATKARLAEMLAWGK
jgi:hypothetical protein